MVYSGAVVCDVGCGDGVFLKYAKEIGAKTFGIDTSAEGIKLAKIFSGCENLYVGSADHLPLELSSADLIVMIDAVNYIQDYKEAIREAAKKLKPGGNLLIMSPSNVSLEEERSTTEDSWQRHVCGIDELRAVIEEGMEIAEISFIKKPVLTDRIQQAIDVLGRTGITGLLRSILSIMNKDHARGSETKRLNVDHGGDIYLDHSYIPRAFIKNYEAIEFVIVAKKR